MDPAYPCLFSFVEKEPCEPLTDGPGVGMITPLLIFESALSAQQDGVRKVPLWCEKSLFVTQTCFETLPRESSHMFRSADIQL